MEGSIVAEVTSVIVLPFSNKRAFLRALQGIVAVLFAQLLGSQMLLLILSDIACIHKQHRSGGG